MEGEPAGEISPRVDLVSSLVWVVIGAAITIGSWRMDRLEHLSINKYEVPGLVPGLLGAAITTLGAILVLRSIRRGALGAGAAGTSAGHGDVALALPAMLLYAVVLVGHGVPFWLATGAFVSAFIFFFDRKRQTGLGRGTVKQLLLALVYGVATSAIVTYVFETLFYVRLP